MRPFPMNIRRAALLALAIAATTLGCAGASPTSDRCLAITGAPPPGTNPTAFPGADGAGAQARGGRGGDVYIVDALDDAGPGSLRNGIEGASGPRTIVFAVAGTIRLRSPLRVVTPFLTIAGQSAPGAGVTVGGDVFQIRSHDVIVRHLRFRPGVRDTLGVHEPDAVWVRGGRDVILDHLSTSWGIDEVLSVTHGSARVTVGWSIIAEALHRAGHHKGDHGYGSLIAGDDLSFHHNLYANNRSRNPRPGDGRVTFANNVIYNPASAFGYSGRNYLELNYVGNVAIAGPRTPPGLRSLFDGGAVSNRLHQRGNLLDWTRNGVPDFEAAGWRDFSGAFTPSYEAFDHSALRIEDARTAFRRVLSSVGASRVRDAVDTRILADLLTGQGQHIGTQHEVGGFPPLASAPAAPDADRDGMPDAWERAHCLDPADPEDRNAPTPDGRTALEAYLAQRAG